MKNRSPIAVLIFSIITLGIYEIVWFVKTKVEMNSKGASIPTAWLIIIPIISIWWMWEYSVGVEHVTGGKLPGILAFLLLFFLGVIGVAIIQYYFNQVGESTTAGAPTMPQASAEPTPVGVDQQQPPQTPPVVQ